MFTTTMMGGGCTLVSSALDLSQHVADSSLSAHIAEIQTRLPPHVNLFVMLFGLGALARDLERTRQEVYRNSVRAAAGADESSAAATKAVKLPGIGERQPSKDELELALIRCVLRSPDHTGLCPRRADTTW